MTDDTSAALERLRLYIEYDGGALPLADARAILAHIAVLEARAKEAGADCAAWRQASSAVSACGETTPLDLREWRPFELSQAIQRIGLRAEAAEAREAALRAALEKIADEHWYRNGYCQTDIGVEPACSAEEAQKIAREALAAAPAAPESQLGAAPILPADPPAEWIEAMRAEFLKSLETVSAVDLSEEETGEVKLYGGCTPATNYVTIDINDALEAAYAALARQMGGGDAE